MSKRVTSTAHYLPHFLVKLIFVSFNLKNECCFYSRSESSTVIMSEILILGIIEFKLSEINFLYSKGKIAKFLSRVRQWSKCLHSFKSAQALARCSHLFFSTGKKNDQRRKINFQSISDCTFCQVKSQKVINFLKIFHRHKIHHQKFFHIF